MGQNVEKKNPGKSEASNFANPDKMWLIFFFHDYDQWIEG